MTGLIHWLELNANVLAILVTVGVAVLLVCCVQCSTCGGKENDELFKHHGA